MYLSLREHVGAVACMCKYVQAQKCFYTVGSVGVPVCVCVIYMDASIGERGRERESGCHCREKSRLLGREEDDG